MSQKTMQRDEIYLVDMWRIFLREWRWFTCALVIVLAITFAFEHLAKRQWEASAWIQIGQVGAAPQGQDPKVEPLARVMERLQLVPFENDVLKSLGFAPDTPEARLYRKSLKLEPLPYAGPLVRLSIRANSPELARRLAEGTVVRLQAVHHQIQATSLTMATARLDQVQNDLKVALAERDRLQQAASNGPEKEAAEGTGSLVATALLASKNQEIRDLRQTQSDLATRLSTTYTYETSAMWPIYVPQNQAFPNPALTWGLGLLVGISLGVFAAVARNALRRKV
jgi:uncharacterized protein involved in exopolysaccharide biosynthesis